MHLAFSLAMIFSKLLYWYSSLSVLDTGQSPTVQWEWFNGMKIKYTVSRENPE
jgi:hypothetical protein